MRQFLRYQISGSVFIIWLIVFYYGKDISDIKILFESLVNDITTVKSIITLLLAFPFGVIIHQFSVVLKNFCVAKVWSEFDDFPVKERVLSVKHSESNYILTKISNLNSFYYVRIDNGVLAPLLAWFIINFSYEAPINCFWIALALINGLMLVLYIPRIRREIKKYNFILQEVVRKQEECDENVL